MQFHGRMLSRKKRAMSAALLSATAATLTVKAAVTGPVGQLHPRLAAAVVPFSAINDDDGRVRPDHPYSRALVRKILVEAAARHQVNPKLVLALSYWESGWDQSRVSETGAVGLMQVQPASAAEAGPALLDRTVDLDNPYDNADVGVAILRQNLDAYGSTLKALAAYYQGETSLRVYGMFPDTQQYVDGILDLANRMNP
jgi:soluble lytic murein transglycosylase-like protein